MVQGHLASIFFATTSVLAGTTIVHRSWARGPSAVQGHLVSILLATASVLAGVTIVHLWWASGLSAIQGHLVSIILATTSVLAGATIVHRWWTRGPSPRCPKNRTHIVHTEPAGENEVVICSERNCGARYIH